MPDMRFQQNLCMSNQAFIAFTSEEQQKWEDPSILDYTMRENYTPFPKFNQPSQKNSNTQTKTTDEQGAHMMNLQEWDPKETLNSLCFVEQKIHQLQELVNMTIIGQKDGLFTQKQQLISADLTSIIIQLISTAGSLLPSAPFVDIMEEEHEIMKDDDDGKEDEHLPPGSYEILQLEKEEILAPHTHFCTICGKGFKRDANLRMHMRGHGDEYKTPAALAKPNRESSSDQQIVLKRYSCPSVGCKRNKEHKKFQPLKTILCVKNHYKRTHCDKSYTCSRCHTKKFSVIADLKTHEKHCGRDKWLCSCGTTFSRKDKLFGHVALFQGHTPAIPMDENKGTPTNKAWNVEFSFDSNSEDVNGIEQRLMGIKANVNVVEDPYLSLLNYDCSLSGLQEFPEANFDDESSSFSFLVSVEKNGIQSAPSDID